MPDTPPACPAPSYTRSVDLGRCLIDVTDVSAALAAAEDLPMPDTPMAHLVLTVPPALAAAWERLHPDVRAYFSQLIVDGWLRAMLEPQSQPPPQTPYPTRDQIQSMTMDELARFVTDLERKFGQQARGDDYV